jgi:integrase
MFIEKRSAPEEATVRTAALVQLDFKSASEAWLDSRRPYISKRTAFDYANYIRTLAAYFGERRLPEISADEIRAYQRMRMGRAGASIINHECSVLQQMLKRIGRWAEIRDDYQPLQLPRESPHRALTPNEEERLYHIGAAHPGWEVAYCAFVISINTTAGPGEIRHIRLMDVHLDDPEGPFFEVQSQGARNPGRMRMLPLNGTAERAMRYLLDRARRLGSHEPQHYLIPFRIHRSQYDPSRPAESWRRAHKELCAATGIRVAPYSFRHHAITKLLENEKVSEQTAEAMAGHISARMKKRYSHIRMQAKREAVAALERIGPRKPVQSVENPSKQLKRKG